MHICMHAPYVIEYIYKLYVVLKDYGEYCRCKERRGSFYVISPVPLFLVIDFFLKRQTDLLVAAVWCFIVNIILDLCGGRGVWNWPFWVFDMGTKMKGIYKYISNIFVEKEAELEIGCPTDVKHVAHIGWEGSSSSAPSWMTEFKTGPDYAATTIGSNGSSLSPWSSQDYGESKGNEKVAEQCKEDMTNSLNIPKPKQKRKKIRPSTFSPKSGSTSSSSRSSRAAKSKSKFVEDSSTKPIQIEAKPINIEVA